MQNVGINNVSTYLPIWFKPTIQIFWMWIFFIRGCFEFHTVDFNEFSLLFLPTSIVMKFCQGISKNLKIDITRCSTNWHWPIIDYPIFDVIEISKELVHWRLYQQPGEKSSPHPLFLCFKHGRLKWKASHEVWFMTIPIGCN